jgi:hypothetical protein
VCLFPESSLETMSMERLTASESSRKTVASVLRQQRLELAWIQLGALKRWNLHQETLGRLLTSAQR